MQPLFQRQVRRMNNEKKEIRFIDSRYRELFRIQDGDSIEISYPNGDKVQRECTFIDEYHTQVGKSVFHICEFAERMEGIGAAYQPVRVPVLKEPERSHKGRKPSVQERQYGKGR